MKKQYKKYFFLSIIFTLLLFALGIVIRYIIDPVGINNKVNLGLYKDVALAYWRGNMNSYSEFNNSEIK